MKLRLIPPEEPVRNLEYREGIRRWALESRDHRLQLMHRCREDYFFWLKSFAWVYEPRATGDRNAIVPFIPWAHQKPMMDTILKHLGERDIGVEKARGEGATWTCLSIFVHQWLFLNMRAFGVVSRVMKTADSPDDPDSLGSKIDWLLSMLPSWMVGEKGYAYRRVINEHTWIRRKLGTDTGRLILPEDVVERYRSGAEDAGSTITAYPTTGDMMSGGRKTAILLDEFAKHPRGPDEEALSSTEPVTECRLLVSTYAGADGAYFRAMHEESDMVKIVLDWKENPIRNQDMFTISPDSATLRAYPSGESRIGWDYADYFFQTAYPVLMARGFNVKDTAKVWSPWYVTRCLRARMNPRKIAQEYDMDPLGTNDGFFPSAIIQNLLSRTTPPSCRVDITVDHERLRVRGIVPTQNGKLRLWLRANGKNWKPTSGRYVLGVDVSTGQGGSRTSNSVISIVDLDSGRKIAEFADQTTPPDVLAEIAIALARWFRNPQGGAGYLIWEGNGPGIAFTNRIMLSDFRNIHWRTPWRQQHGKRSKEPGWWSVKASKYHLLSGYRLALTEGFFDNPCEDSLRECLQYVEDGNEKVVFQGAEAKDDPLNSGENHGDRVIADALANLAMEELGGGASRMADEKTKKETDWNAPAPQGSFLSRLQQYQKHDRASRGNEWCAPDRGVW